MSLSFVAVLGMVFSGLLVALAHARSPISERGWRSWVGASALLGSALAAHVLLDPQIGVDPGRELAPGFVDDPLARFFDFGILAAIAAAVLAGVGGSRRAARVVPAMAIGGLGVSMVGHAGGLATMVVGLELAALASLVATDAPPAERRRVAWTSVLIFLGAAFVFGATAGLGFDQLPQRIATVFNRWGGAQRYALPLPGETALPTAFVNELVKGMAPAALAFAGVVALAAGLAARILVPATRSLGVESGRDALDGVLVASVLRRAPAVIALVRVHVALLHTPRLVSEPYGWNGVFPALAVAAVLLGGVTALRSRSIARLVDGLLATASGLTLATIAAAANYHGHRALVDRPVSPKEELVWSGMLADHGSMTVLLWWSAALLGVSALVAVIHGAGIDTDEVADLEAVGRAHPVLGITGLLGAATLVGAPPTLGGVAAWEAFASLVEHSSLWKTAAWLALALVPGWLAVLRLAERLFAGSPASSQRRPRFDPQMVAVLAAALTLVGGLTPVVRDVALDAGSGLSFDVGSEPRREWLERRARGFSAAAESPSADAADEEPRPWRPPAVPSAD
jgi:NADH:ubiquinone oxidoreductase subunit 2 (subunit N)